MSVPIVVILLSAFLTALLMPRYIYPLLNRLGTVDIPNERSSHTLPTVRGMGIVQAIVLAGGTVAAIFMGEMNSEVLTIVAVAAAMGAVVGLVEDLRGLPSTVRALLQLCIGSGVMTIFSVEGDVQLWLAIAGALYVASYINVANFMDGINGISGLHGGVVGLTYCAVGYISNITWLTFMGALLAAVFTAFLPWNFSARRMFLGDVGSYLLGAAIAVTGVAAFIAGVELIVIAAPLSVYMIDSGVTLLRRVVQGKRWFEAHREHVYQRMAKTSSGHLRVAIYVALLSAIGGSVALLVQGGLLNFAGAIGVLALVVGLYMLTPHINYMRIILNSVEGEE